MASGWAAFQTTVSVLVANFHGVVFSAWVLLFFVQARLISTRRVRWHLKLGVAQ